MLADMTDDCPECARLRAECDELRALVAEQFEGLATLRREIDTMCSQNAKWRAEISDLLLQRWHLRGAIEAELAERLGLTVPARN
jgi:hypothetical protein